MLIDTKIDPNDTMFVLMQLDKSNYNFFLTGSRFFQSKENIMKKEFTDWDFYTQFSEELEQWLLEKGFKFCSESYKDDLNMTKVYKKGSIDIQLVTDLEKKHLVQGKLHQWGLLTNPYISKTLNRLIWKTAYVMLEK